MKITLKVKLAAVFILIATLTAGVLYLVNSRFNANRFDQFVLDQQVHSVVASLSEYYQSHGSWEGLSSSLDSTNMACDGEVACTDHTLSEVMGGGRGQGAGGGAGGGALGGMGPGAGQGGNSAAGQGGNQAAGMGPQAGQGLGIGEGRRLFGLADEDGILLIAHRDNMDMVGLAVPVSELDRGEPIMVNEKQVGTLLLVRRLPSYSAAEKQYIDRNNRAFVVAFYGALLVSAVLGVMMAELFSVRIRSLKDAATKLSQGDLTQQVQIWGNDEVSELGVAFNNMSKQLRKSDDLRKQMTADVAHDLRTPLTVVSGYIESMRDGDLDPSPERFGVIHDEIRHLEQLVGDLRLLSQTDAGELKLNMQSLDPAELLYQAKKVFAHEANQKQIEITVKARVGEVLIQGDELRLMQVLENLMANALRYTPEGREITLSSSLVETTSDRFCVIEVEDTGSGIEQSELDLIFERFHRADRSRHTDENQSGLGLAIVKGLVLAHGGEILAESELDQGTKFTIILPTTPDFNEV